MINRRALAVLLALLTFGLAIRQSRAAEAICPPKRYACWQVKIAAATIGEATLESRAKACGWSDAEIARARKCLK